MHNGGVSAPTPRPPHPVDGIRVAQVLLPHDQVVTLTFHGDLTPVEAVAAFLRDVADAVHPHDAAMDILADLADQLDPPYIQPAPVDPAPGR